jgi:hypothetical protein
MAGVWTPGRYAMTPRWCSGFDGSYSGDATAIVVVELGDVPHLDVVRVWEPAVAAVMAFAAASTTEPGPQPFVFD